MGRSFAFALLVISAAVLAGVPAPLVSAERAVGPPAFAVRGVGPTDRPGTGTAASMSISNFTASPAHLSTGGSTILQVNLSGGESPFTYLFTGLPSPCLPANIPRLACTPMQSGRFTVIVSVLDASGARANRSLTLVVDPAPTTSPGFSGTDAVLVGAAGMFVLLGALLMLRGSPHMPGRSRPPSPPVPPPPGSELTSLPPTR